jgi:hypothetical protein
VDWFPVQTPSVSRGEWEVMKLSGKFSIIVGAVITLAQPSHLPRFEDYPVASVYRGPISPPNLTKQAEMYRKVIADGIRHGVNFAGSYVVVRFSIGDGPLGVILVDALSGNVLKLPKAVVGDSYFVAATSCLALNEGRSYLDQEDTQVLSFRVDSELMTIRQCTHTGWAKRFYHLSKGKWHFITRLVPPPPPPVA